MFDLCPHWGTGPQLVLLVLPVHLLYSEEMLTCTLTRPSLDLGHMQPVAVQGPAFLPRGLLTSP